jgi:hypothetical protein
MQQKHAETMHEAAGSESPQSFEQAMPCPKSYVVRTIQNHKPPQTTVRILQFTNQNKPLLWPHSSHILPINRKHPLPRLPDFRCPLRLQDFQDVQTGDHHLWMTWTKVRRAPASAFPSTSRPCPWCAVFATLPTRMQLTSELPFNKGHRGS